MKRTLSWLLTLSLILGLCGCAVPASAPSAAGTSSAAAAAAPAASDDPAATAAQDGETLRVDFLDVGQADSALIQCGDDAMLIDGGNVADSSYVVSFLKSQGVTHLDYVVGTHPHEDHVGGLSGVLNTCTVDHVLCTTAEADGDFFADFQKYTAAQGLSIEVPQPNDVFSLGGATVTVLGPVASYTDVNNTSLVLSVDFGETSFLFTGDMGTQAENDLLNAGVNVSADVLKVGHHGSSTGTSSAFLDAVGAKYAVISVGEDNPYGLPSDSVLERLQNYGVTTYRTDQNGTVTCISDGVNLTFTSEKGAAISPSPTSDSAVETDTTYIGNVNSKVFHRTTCPNLPSAENQIVFSSRQAAIDAGYRPCGNCDP